MRVEVDELRRATRALRWRANALAACLTVITPFVFFSIVIGIAMVLMPTQPGDAITGVFCALAGGVAPGIGVVAAVLLCVTWRRRAVRLEKVAWFAESANSLAALEAKAIEGSLGLSAGETRELVRDAWAMGIFGLAEAETSAMPLPSPAQAAPISQPAPAPTQAPPPRSDSLVGVVLNETYRIERHLGGGAMGSVWVARHLRTGGFVALKTLHPDARLSPSALSRFRLEATTSSAIGHEGIVRVFDFDTTKEGLYFLAMELLEGETLEQRLGAVGRLPFAEARRITREIGSALHAAHSVGILHRDLKPANVFLRAPRPGTPPFERAVLLDFGLAKPLDQTAPHLTEAGVALGTPAYMSPEQARGHELDARSDVFSLGALFYEMVMGEPPFYAPSVAALFAKLLTEAPRTSSIPPDCPAGFIPVLGRALAKHPAERYGSVVEFMAALDAIEASQAVYESGPVSRFVPPNENGGNSSCA